MGNLGGGKKKT